MYSNQGQRSLVTVFSTFLIVALLVSAFGLLPSAREVYAQAIIEETPKPEGMSGEATPTAPGPELEKLPNLVAHVIDGWSGAIVLDTVKGTILSGRLTAGSDIYVDWAAINSGGVQAPEFRICLLFDEYEVECWNSAGLAVGAVETQQDWLLPMPVSVGAHRLELVLDVDNAIVESNEDDNRWAFDFEWFEPQVQQIEGGSPLVHDALIPPVIDDASANSSSGSSAPGYYDFSEYMSGKVAVSIVFPESNGNGENWSPARRDSVINEIQAGLNWWESQATMDATPLRFQYDIRYQIPTSYEPISLSSSDQGLWIDQVLASLGASGSGYWNKIYAYNNAVRNQYQTDWVVTIFVVDSLNDADGRFTDGYFGYAYLGGPFLVMTYDNDGWGIDKMDTVAAHEMAHIFRAGDHYYEEGYGGCESTTELYGYLGIANSNCEYNNPSADPNSIMNNNSWILHWTTAHQIGWRNLDGDELVDVIDTQPVLVLDSYTPDPTSSPVITYQGRVYDNPYPHHPYLSINDITVNEITGVWYSVDSGPWMDATPDDGVFDTDFEYFHFSTPALSAGTHTIQVQAGNKVTAYSAIWSDSITVQIPPTSFNKSSPANGASGIVANPTLSWASSTGATSYEYCYDTSNNNSCNASWVSVGSNTSTILIGLGSNTTYYWQVRARNPHGATDAGGGWWSFSTALLPPAAFDKSTPANGSTGISISPTLVWNSAAGAARYEYCYDATNDQACSNWAQTGTNLSVSLSGLSYSTTYYWQVRAVNAAGTTYANGTYWSFTTRAAPPVNDDFAAAVLLSAPVSLDISLATTAADDPIIPCVSGQKYKTVWYRYTPSSNGTYTIQTNGSNYDTVLGLWTGSRGSLQNAACDDDSGDGSQSLVSLHLSGGVSYFVEVAAYNDISSGMLALNSSFVPDNPTPVISNVSPGSALAGTPFTLTVNGNGFVESSQIRWNSTNLVTQYVSSTQLVASVTNSINNQAGTISITVFNPTPGGGTSNSRILTIQNPVPVLDSITPVSARANSATFTLTMSGSNFVPSSIVSWDETNLPTTFVNSSQLTVSVDSSRLQIVKSVPIVVTNPAPGGGQSGVRTFQVTNPIPVITRISPTTALVGNTNVLLEIHGYNFVSSTKIQLNGNELDTQFVNDEIVYAFAPNEYFLSAGTLTVTVFNPAPDGGASNPVYLQVNNPVPTMTGLSPASVVAGAGAFTLTVNGTRFVTGSKIKWNDTDLTTTVASATQLTATVPTAYIANAGTASITVWNPTPGGGTSSASTITINNPTPVIEGLNPDQRFVGSGAFSLSVTGRGFVSTSKVRWNGNDLITTYNSSTQLTAAVPAGNLLTAAAINLTVYNPAPGGGSSTAVAFPVVNPVPQLTSISPESIQVGGGSLTLTLNGSNFVSTSKARWNGSELTTAFISATKISASVPSSYLATGGTITITVYNPAPGGGASEARTFTINNRMPAISSLSPASTIAGNSDVSLTVNGSNFVTTSVVKWNGAALATTYGSSTRITAVIPAANLATGGTASVTLNNPAPGGGESTASTFIINNGTPSITSLSPEGTVVGSEAVTLTVNGTNFVTTSIIRWEGIDLVTTYISSTQLTARLSAERLNTQDWFEVRVFNPLPGGGTSAARYFKVASPTPGICQAASSIHLGDVVSGNNGASGSTLNIDQFPNTNFNTHGPEYTYAFHSSEATTLYIHLMYGWNKKLTTFLVDGSSGSCNAMNLVSQSVEGDNGSIQNYIVYNIQSNHDYYVVVDGYNGNIGDYTLRVSEFTPRNGMLVTGSRPTFNWPVVSGALNYRIQVSTSSSFKSTIISKVVTGTSYSPTSNLPADKQLYWRVKTNTGDYIYMPNGYLNFLSANPPGVPTLSKPVSNQLVTMYQPLFDWKDVSWPKYGSLSGYHVQVATDPAFSELVVSEETPISQYQVVGVEFEPNTKYYWRVSSIASDGDTSNWSKVYTFRSAVLPPNLTAPDNALAPAVQTSLPTFAWDAVEGASAYTLQVSTRSDFKSLVLKPKVTGIEYTPTKELPKNKVLYWRVRAEGSNGPSLWSEVWQFTSANPPGRPTLLSPKSNALITVLAPVFDWKDASLPVGITLDHYEIQIAQDAGFIDAIEVESEFSTFQADSGMLAPNTKYYWRLRAVGSNGHYSPWSKTWYFRMAMLAPTLLLPDDSDLTVSTRWPAFDWNDVEGATSYTIQVSKSSSFSSTLINKTVSGKSSYTASSGLPTGITLKWRVRANGANGPSPWSEVHIFMIAP